MSYHRGTEIIVSARPGGRFLEGPISGALLPGTIVQIDVNANTTTAVGDTGEFTWEVYDVSGSGARPVGPLGILLNDPAKNTWGLNTTAYPATTTEYIYSAYASGDHGYVYVPLPGEEFNILLQNTGTAALSSGDICMVADGTGYLLTQSSPEFEPFITLIDIADPGAGGPALVHVIYSGY